MEPPNENKPGPNWVPIIACIAFTVWGLVAIHTGHISMGRRYHHVYYLAQDPHGFWRAVGFNFLIAGIFFVMALVGKR
jgi:hypothetical protein